jgi:hypothetical protein
MRMSEMFFCTKRHIFLTTWCGTPRWVAAHCPVEADSLCRQSRNVAFRLGISAILT